MRRRSSALLLSLLLPGVLAGTAVAAPVPGSSVSASTSASMAASMAAVIVQGSGATAAVEAAGGQVTRALPIVDGVAATVPSSALARVEQVPGVRAVTPDQKVSVQGGGDSNDSTVNHVVNREIGADELHAHGLTGKGVRIAVVDTGISPVQDLRGRIVPVTDPNDGNALDGRAKVACVDFSGEESCNDSYGHGTFMSGLAAGNGAASGGVYKGTAPGADLISIKIAGADGSSDVSKVLAAIQWAVSFKDQYGIRVLNLSLGTDSRNHYRADPLNYAVERAWRSGLVVVVAASNRGPAADTISKPADDPLVLTVGAVDDRETPATSDDLVPPFSGRGPSAHGLAKADVVAPGARVIGLRSPGSTIERLAPSCGIDDVYRRGSGTSMSAAVVSGLTALLLEAQPSWTPDRVKFALMSAASKVGVSDPLAVGRGLVHGPSALAAGPGLANLDFPGIVSSGTDSIDKSRGTVRVTGECGDASCTVSGDDTAQGGWLNDFDSGAYQGEWSGHSWYSSQWVSPLGHSWYGHSWYGQSWYGHSWYGTEGTDASDDTFYGVSVPGSAWYGAWK
jgi:serine protease AprX